MLHSIYDLTTFCRKTAGDVPAKLVGASTTVVGSKMYLFGGRLVTERKMVADLYMFDLETFVWEKVPMSPEDPAPQVRYFHSADAWNNYLVIFGGMSNQPDSVNPDELCVLNDVWYFDLSTRRWISASLPPLQTTDPNIPRARYAHLSSITADRLFIIGGQDFFNTWLDDVCVFDLVGKTWVLRREYQRHCGTYRSVAVSSNMSVRLPQEELQNSRSRSDSLPSSSFFKSAEKAPTNPSSLTPSEKLIHLPYSAIPSEDHPSDIYLYSNYNFTDVKRELEVFSPLPDNDYIIQDRSAAMTGSTFPPGLRFPTGAILGTHLIIAGTYLAHSYQSFSIWVLDLISMTWSRIDPGKAVETGSWFRGCLWAESNKFLIFGNRNGNLVDDYNRRLLSWDHVAVVDLEAFGIYQPPPLKLDTQMQEMGLAALEEGLFTDFEILCDDGRKIACSRKIIEERWPWLKEQRKLFLRTAKATLESLPSSLMHIALPELPGTATVEEPQLDPRLTARSFHISEPYPVVMGLLQYFYTLALITPLQHTPAVLSQLLILASTYEITHLTSLVKHAMHRALSNSTSVGVYEVATLCSCRSLQIRALKTVMSYTQKRPSRSRGEKEGGGRPPDSSGGSGPSSQNGGGGGGYSGDSSHMSRPRGTSDAKWRTKADSSNTSGYVLDSNHTNNGSVTEEQRTVLLDTLREMRRQTRSGSLNSNALSDDPASPDVQTSPSETPLSVLKEETTDTDESNAAKNISSTITPDKLPISSSAERVRKFQQNNPDLPQRVSGALHFHLPRPRPPPIDTTSDHSDPPPLTPSTTHGSPVSLSHDELSPKTPYTIPSLVVSPSSFNQNPHTISEREHSILSTASDATKVSSADYKGGFPWKKVTSPTEERWLTSDSESDHPAPVSPIAFNPSGIAMRSQNSITNTIASRFLPKSARDRKQQKINVENAKILNHQLPMEFHAVAEDEKKHQRKDVKARKTASKHPPEPKKIEPLLYGGMGGGMLNLAL